MNNRIQATFNAKQDNKNNGDMRKAQMQAKTVQESAAKLHEFILKEIQKMVPDWRRALVRAMIPNWLNSGLARILNLLPPPKLIQWAVSPTFPHMAYKWLILLPLVIPASIIRMLIVNPLYWLQNRIYLFGIKRDIKQVDEFRIELVLAMGKTVKTFRQDWRYGEVKEWKPE